MSVEENVPAEIVENSESTAQVDAESQPNENVEVEEKGNEEVETPKSTPKRKPRYRDLQAEIRNMEAKFEDMSEAVGALYNQVGKNGESTNPTETKPLPESVQTPNYDRTFREYKRKADNFDKDLLQLKRSDDKAEREIAREAEDIIEDTSSNVRLLSPEAIQQCLNDNIEPHEVIELEKKLEENNFSPSAAGVEVRRIKKILKDIRKPQAIQKKVKAPMEPIGKIGGQPKSAPPEKDFDFFMARFRK